MSILEGNVPPEVGAAGGIAGIIATIAGILASLRRGRSEDRIGLMKAEAEARRVDTEERDAASHTLLELVGSLRADIGRLREELEAERGLRAAAQREVHDLRAEVEALRKALVVCGIAPAGHAAPLGEGAV